MWQYFDKVALHEHKENYHNFELFHASLESTTKILSSLGTSIALSFDNVSSNI